MIDLLTIGAAIVPALIDVVKGAASKWIAPEIYKPLNVNEYVAMSNADTARFTAINAAGQGATSYPWVEAVIRLQRPAVAAVTLAVWALVHIDPSYQGGAATVDNIAGAVFFYLFGDRTLAYVAKEKKT